MNLFSYRLSSFLCRNADLIIKIKQKTPHHKAGVHKTVKSPYEKSCGDFSFRIAANWRKGAAPCSERSDAKQPGLQSSGLSASQSAHTGLAPV